MDFFGKRRREVKRIVKEYEKIFNKEIPENSPYIEDLEELKRLDLESLATRFDLLKGWEYTKTLVPGLSRYCPETFIQEPLSYSLGVLSELKSKFLYLKFLRDNPEFITYPSYSRGIQMLPLDSKNLWKRII